MSRRRVPTTVRAQSGVASAAGERLRRLGGVLCLIALAGVAWYTLAEHWSLLEAVYMTVTTLATVGYMEVRPRRRLAADPWRLRVKSSLRLGV